MAYPIPDPITSLGYLFVGKRITAIHSKTIDDVLSDLTITFDDGLTITIEAGCGINSQGQTYPYFNIHPFGSK